MKQWILNRYIKNNRYTLGVLREYIENDENNNNNIFFYTLELPYNNNKPFESCIPEGEYILQPHISPKFKKCFKIKEVKNRTNILIHSGNTINDTKGCILIGNNTNNEGIVGESRKALNELLKIINEEVRLKIC